MQTYTTIISLQEELDKQRQAGKKIGFVPTMGALHEGHISLVKEAAKTTDFVVCSIFVNPIQFNNSEDLAKYPRTVDRDLLLLEKSGCNAVFIPTVKEMYPNPEQKEHYDFGDLEKVMEGKFRPGHFNGVGVVVKRLFDIVEPDKAFFGEKDFQQLAIIKKLVSITRQKVEIVPCPIVREQDGLAMSSRNMRLSEEERQIAPYIYKTLSEAKKMMPETPAAIMNYVTNAFEQNKVFRLEYFELVDDTTLQPITDFSAPEGVVGCIAVWLGSVRLIDVLRFK